MSITFDQRHIQQYCLFIDYSYLVPLKAIQTITIIRTKIELTTNM